MKVDIYVAEDSLKNEYKDININILGNYSEIHNQKIITIYSSNDLFFVGNDLYFKVKSQMLV